MGYSYCLFFVFCKPLFVLTIGCQIWDQEFDMKQHSRVLKEVDEVHEGVHVEIDSEPVLVVPKQTFFMCQNLRQLTQNRRFHRTLAGCGRVDWWGPQITTCFPYLLDRFTCAVAIIRQRLIATPRLLLHSCEDCVLEASNWYLFNEKTK